MRYTTRILKWALTALAFASAACLAIGTAAIKADNVRKRRELESIYGQISALESTAAFEEVEWEAAIEQDRLAEYWDAMVQSSRGEEGRD